MVILEDIRVESGLQCRILVDIMTEHGMRCWYPLFALIFGVLHNVIALRLYRKKGDKVASVFLVVTIAVILFAILILWRLLGEG